MMLIICEKKVIFIGVYNWEVRKMGEKVQNKELAPIVLFTYKRPLHTKKIIEALKMNVLAKKSTLYIYSDGARNEEDIELVNQVRKYIYSIEGFKNIEIIERKKNWGLGRNIIDGVTRIVNEFGKIIVLEDDIVTSKKFLHYMNDALNIYENEEKVMQISGSVVPFHQLDRSTLKETFFTTTTQTGWGWATWKTRWDKFHRDPVRLVKTYDKEKIKLFNESNGPGSWQQVLDNYTGKIYTWGIFFHACIFENNGLILYPKYALSSNIGFDGSGDNCGITNYFDVEIEETEINFFETNITYNKTIKNEIHKMIYSRKYDLLKFVQLHKNICCYGAGQYGRTTKNFLSLYDVDIDMFLVSSVDTNLTNLDGIAIKGVDNIDMNFLDGVIISLSEKYHSVIKDLLKKKSCKLERCFFIDDNLIGVLEDEVSYHKI